MKQKVKNPYLKEFIRISKDLFYTSERYDLCFKYSFAIPNQEAIDAILKYSPIIELGAGNGYWAYLLQKTSNDKKCIEPYDNFSWESFKNPFTIITKGDESILLNQPSHKNLLLCWPNYNEPFAYNAAKNFTGRYIIYIGEGNGGCTGDDNFHDFLKEKFKLIEKIDIPQWRGLHDSVRIYDRKN